MVSARLTHGARCPSMLRIVSRLFCVGYCTALTVLLLVPNPLRLLGLKRLPGPPDGRGIHFVLLAGLTLLVHAARWPIGRKTLLGLLIGYGILTETFQWWFPPRTVELLDYIENVTGVLVGAGIWWAFERQQATRKDWEAAVPASPETK